MLAFLIGTSILNIFLGYALAVYLMRESLTVENHRLASQLNSNGAAGGRQREQSDLYSSDGETPETAAVNSQPLPAGEADSGDAAPNRPGQPSGETPSAEDVNRSAEDLDQQLLAGIADFRSQLAKLRAESTTEEPKWRSSGRAAAK